MKIFIICSVRNATNEYKVKLEKYVKILEEDGYEVHLPHRNTNQDETGLNICQQNKNAIIESDEVHLFYMVESTGIHFDLGIAFAYNKPLVVFGKSYNTGFEPLGFGNVIKVWEGDKHESKEATKDV